MTETTPLERLMRLTPLRLGVAAFASISAMLAFWYYLVLREDFSPLFSGLAPSEAAAVVSELDTQGVRYRLQDGGAAILVPTSQVDALRLRLASSNLPISGLDGFELFDESDMGLTDFAQKVRYQRALQGEIARTIMRMDGVVEARVHLSIPERALFRAERRNAEAAVNVVMRTPELETPARVEGIQRLVAAAVPDLAVNDVVVLNGRGEVISPRVGITQSSLEPNSDGGAALSAEAVMEIARRALPNLLFEISIAETPHRLAGGGLADADSATRAPERVITVFTEARLAPIDMERLSNELRAAGVIDGADGGTLEFRISPPRFPEAAVTIASPNQPATLPAGTWPPLMVWVVWAILCLLVAVLAIMVLRQRTRPSLSFEEHKRIAEELRASLSADGAADIAPNLQPRVSAHG
jgi:flagellar M-ring protein FliF